MSETPKTSPPAPNSQIASTSLSETWEQELQALDAQLLDYGLTVEVITQPADTSKFVATFHNPSGKPPQSPEPLPNTGLATK
jgi:hypothetical protein